MFNFSTDNIVAIITTFIGAILGYLTCRFTLNKPHRIKILERQLYDVYLPLFQKIEPNLYKTITKEISKDYIDFFNEIKKSHYEIIDSELCNLFWIFENEYNSGNCKSDTYSYICLRLATLFEMTRRKLHYPTRTFSYKLNRRQFPKRVFSTMYYLLKTMSKLLSMYLLIILFIIVSNSIYSLVHSIITWFATFIHL